MLYCMWPRIFLYMTYIHTYIHTTCTSASHALVCIINYIYLKFLHVVHVPKVRVLCIFFYLNVLYIRTYMTYIITCMYEGIVCTCTCMYVHHVHHMYIMCT